MGPLRKDLRAICADGTGASVMVGIGENYFPAFVLALTASQFACGLVATVPMLLGAALQLGAPWLLGRVRSYRRWVVLCAALQALTFLPLLGASLAGAMPAALAFAVIALYWATGLGSGPAWNVWAGNLVPSRIRPRFFARRSLLGQAGLMAGFVLGGVLLQWGQGAGAVLPVFSILFALAAASRLYSAVMLAKQSDAGPGPAPGPSLWALFRSFRRDAPPRVLLYLLAMQMAVQVSGPYFNPYMFVQLRLSYWSYVVLVCAAYVAKLAMLPTLGRVAERLGPQRMLWMSGLAIAPLPLLWTFSDDFTWLVLIQCYSGAVWAGHELAMLLLFFRGIPPEKRVAVLTVFNLASAAVYVAGSLVGGVLLSGFGTTRQGYAVLFGASTAARLASMLLLVPASCLSAAGLAALLRPAAGRTAATVFGNRNVGSAVLQLPQPAPAEPLATAAPSGAPRIAPLPMSAVRGECPRPPALADAA